MMTTTIDPRITVPSITAIAPLYMRYDREVNPQPAYLEIDIESDTAQWDWDGEIGGGVPMGVWHGVRRRVAVSPYLTGQQIHDLSVELLPLIERVWAGGSVEWDGSNHVGEITEDASDALTAIGQRIEQEVPEAQVWDAAEWISDTHGVTTETTDDEIATLAAALIAQAASDGIALDGNVEAYLIECRDDARADDA